VDEALQRREAGMGRTPPIIGYDRDARAIRSALSNANRAAVEGLIHLERREISRVEPPRSRVSGLIIANPPYGQRLGEVEDLKPLYEQLGDLLKARFSGWKAGVFTGNPELGRRMGLRAYKINTFYNGPLPCKLLQFSVEPEFFVDREVAEARARQAMMEKALAGGAEPFVNRLRKNLRTLGRWAQREEISCYRLYDADIPEYAVAVDIYQQWVHVQEYEAPRSVDPAQARERLNQIMTVLPEVLEVPAEHIFLKVRRRQKGLSQYEKTASQGRFYEVHEGPYRFLVNFTDFLDTGLFLDHRSTRRMIGELSPGRRFLNLFGYTGTATAHAALNGAASTTTVDMSNTYLAWARRNLALNGIGGRDHDLVRADCLEWLDRDRGRYDLIFLDPPTFSSSKRMQGTLDVQRDHVELIRQTVQRLDKQGILIFSNNYRRFKLDREALSDLDIEDITRQTIPKDFERNPRIHHCWRMTF
jgi:23S rRNA (guanine2445-N2)-methyltransferase / 23S rRNA (guanine2069-N7)-methyltransferase